MYLPFIEAFMEIRQSIPKEDLPKLQKLIDDMSFSRLVEDLKRQEHEEDKKFCNVLVRHEWWVRFDWDFTGDELRHICALDGTPGGGEKVDRFVCEKFRENNFQLLDEKTEVWRNVPYLRLRQKLIKDAIDAHKEGKYTLSIPALLPLIDGLAAEIAIKIPNSSGLARNKKKARRIGLSGVEHVKHLADSYHKLERERVQKTFDEWEESVWSAIVVEGVRERVYKHYDYPGKAPPSVLSRHAILHGRVDDYATEANSLRTILLLHIFAGLGITGQESPATQTASDVENAS
jgi:hypothetical protein